jgi:hypothetical protein
MNDERLTALIETSGTGWIPGAAYRSGWTVCPGCGAAAVENGSYAGHRACWIVTRCRACGYSKTIEWTD